MYVCMYVCMCVCVDVAARIANYGQPPASEKSVVATLTKPLQIC